MRKPPLRKFLGQHHLVSGTLVRPLIEYLDPQGLRVLEIGPGGGILTSELIAAGARVIGWELDPGWAIHLHRALPELSLAKKTFGLVFVDAPYANDISNGVIAMLASLNLVAPEGWIVIRQFKRAPEAPPAPDGFEQFTVSIIGDHRIAYYRRSSIGAEIASG